MIKIHYKGGYSETKHGFKKSKGLKLRTLTSTSSFNKIITANKIPVTFQQRQISDQDSTNIHAQRLKVEEEEEEEK